MANIASQEKRNQRSLRERLENRRYTSSAKTYFRRLESAVQEGDTERAEQEYRTLGYQAGRDSPFSIWGQEPQLDWLHVGVLVFAGLLALGVAFYPRRKSPMQVAALAAAVMVAVELTAEHWFYLYIVWFAPLVLVASFLQWRTDPPPGPLDDPLPDYEDESAAARSRREEIPSLS